MEDKVEDIQPSGGSNRPHIDFARFTLNDNDDLLYCHDYVPPSNDGPQPTAGPSRPADTDDRNDNDNENLTSRPDGAQPSDAPVAPEVDDNDDPIRMRCIPADPSGPESPDSKPSKKTAPKEHWQDPFADPSFYWTASDGSLVLLNKNSKDYAPVVEGSSGSKIPDNLVILQGRPKKTGRKGRSRETAGEGQAKETHNDGNAQETIDDGNAQEAAAKGKGKETAGENSAQETAEESSAQESTEGNALLSTEISLALETARKGKPKETVVKDNEQEYVTGPPNRCTFYEHVSGKHLGDWKDCPYYEPLPYPKKDYAGEPSSRTGILLAGILFISAFLSNKGVRPPYRLKLKEPEPEEIPLFRKKIRGVLNPYHEWPPHNPSGWTMNTSSILVRHVSASRTDPKDLSTPPSLLPQTCLIPQDTISGAVQDLKLLTSRKLYPSGRPLEYALGIHLETLWANSTGADLVIFCGPSKDKCFKVHSWVVCPQSAVLRRAVEGKTGTAVSDRPAPHKVPLLSLWLSEEEAYPTAFETLLWFCYTGRIKPSGGIAIPDDQRLLQLQVLHYLAHKYGFTGVGQTLFIELRVIVDTWARMNRNLGRNRKLVTAFLQTYAPEFPQAERFRKLILEAIVSVAEEVLEVEENREKLAGRPIQDICLALGK